MTKSKSRDARESNADPQSERNRRLIPYTTYYVTHNTDQSNSIIQNTPNRGEQDIVGAIRTQTQQPTAAAATATTKQPSHLFYNDEFHNSVEPNDRYAYIPIAYIPGVRTLHYNNNNNNNNLYQHHQQQQPHQHYQNTNYFQPTSSALDTNPIYVDDRRVFAAAVTSPTGYTTATHQPPSTVIDKKVPPYSYYGDYLLEPGTGPGTGANFYSYVNTPLTYAAANAFKTAPKSSSSSSSYQAASPKTPILFSTPHTDYLNFRYSEAYRTQAPKYDEATTTLTPTPTPLTTTTPPTVEITSPKHYTVGAFATATQSSATRQHHHQPSTTSSYSSPLYNDYRELAQVAQFGYSPSQQQQQHLKPAVTDHKPVTIVASKPVSVAVVGGSGEQATQPSKTLMTIVKSQEIRYDPSEQPPYDARASASPPKSDTNVIAAAGVEYGGASVAVDDLFASYYDLNKRLPERITPENLKDSIRTLSYILQMLQKADSIAQFQQPGTAVSGGDYAEDVLDALKEAAVPSPPPHSLVAADEHKSVSPLQSVDVAYDNGYDGKNSLLADKPLKDEQSTPGRAGIDYPTLAVIPETSFSCKTQRYKGFFADPDTKCQVWHYCDLNGGQASFLCPNGTIFSQAAVTCDWWFNVKCASTPQLYVLNERLYKYIIPMRPSFPEDFSGPLVDQYLTEKFKEIESKRKYRYPTNATTVKTDATSNTNMTATFNEYEIPAHLLNENL